MNKIMVRPLRPYEKRKLQRLKRHRKSVSNQVSAVHRRRR